MKKFRILRRGGWYYPQWRYFFTWYFFYTKDIAYNTYENRVFDSEQEALVYIACVECETIIVNKKSQSNSCFSLFSTGNITQQNNKGE